MESLIRYFNQLPKNKQITAEDVKDAAANTGDISAIIESILAHAEAQGINPKKELASLDDARAAAQAEKEGQKRRADIKAATGKMSKHLSSLSANIETAPLDELSEVIAEINAEAAGLTTSASKINRYPTWSDYDTAWKKESEHDFSPELFNRLSFPEGTVSYIGARTGRGKTSALVTIGMEALFPLKQNIKHRRILFISLGRKSKANIAPFFFMFGIQRSILGK